MRRRRGPGRRGPAVTSQATDPPGEPMPRIAIDVMLKPEILDPEGRTIERALPGLGYEDVRDVRAGKHLEMDVAAEGEDLAGIVDKMCADFLTNPVIETYTWRILDGDGGA
jgi:phosphoribosylformylglycinamidine synthase subunit PurS